VPSSRRAFDRPLLVCRTDDRRLSRLRLSRAGEQLPRRSEQVRRWIPRMSSSPIHRRIAEGSAGDADRFESERRQGHRRRAHHAARRHVRALCENQELSLARLGPAFPRLSPFVGRTGGADLRHHRRHCRAYSQDRRHNAAHDEARRIAANIAKLPVLLARESREALEAIKAEVGSLLFSAMTAPRPHCVAGHIGFEL
jgi:hypothetical protein